MPKDTLVDKRGHGIGPVLIPAGDRSWRSARGRCAVGRNAPDETRRECREWLRSISGRSAQLEALVVG